jgi:hypothetical protein
MVALVLGCIGETCVDDVRAYLFHLFCHLSLVCFDSVISVQIPTRVVNGERP